jgi:hypothetical protein
MPTTARGGPNDPVQPASDLQFSPRPAIRHGRVVASLPLRQLFVMNETKRDRLMGWSTCADSPRPAVGDPEPLLRKADGWPRAVRSLARRLEPDQHAGVLTAPLMLFQYGDRASGSG